MLQTLKNAFKIKDVRRRIFYVLLMLVVIISKNGLRVSPVMRSISLTLSLAVPLPKCPYLH